MPDQTDAEPDTGLHKGPDPAEAVGDAEPAGGVPDRGPNDQDEAGPQAGEPAQLSEMSRRVELNETFTQNRLDDGREESIHTTRIDETVRRTAVPHQAPGSAYPAPVG